ncbi:CHAT domain-containing protein [Corallococcus interemptor]|uniref:CHAT domain-containing protein n=1 Tax=Corallococcus interemptor TaxID=2316720 RepID=A0A3A8Q836_9BACT|nr:CHAT domain-containing tetratricopeptide repeat protein [Corallococcus interemptor]RKH64863.1 CHAT domain-containing protein [Corallococcus interemptor]
MRRGLVGMLVVLVCCAQGAAAADTIPALTPREAAHDSPPPEAASDLDRLGLQLLLRGDLVQAEPLLLRALALREATQGRDHPDVSRTLLLLARLYAAQELFSRAEPLLLRALALRETARGRDAPDAAEPLHRLANLYLAQDRYSRAEPLYLRALTLQEADPGRSPLEVAETLVDLAGLYHQQMLYARAEPLYLRALALREATLGTEHPLLAEPLYWLAVLHRQQGRSARAAPLFARARALWETALGQDPADAADVLNRLAALHESQGLYAQAHSLLERALALREATLGERHPLVAESLNLLGRNLQLWGLLGQAEPLHQRALAIREATLGGTHDRVADSLAHLGALYMEQGSYARAQPLFERALAIWDTALGGEHAYVAHALIALANLHVAQGDYPGAEPLLRRGLAILERVCGAHHPLVAAALTNLAGLHAARGQYRRATRHLERALSIQEAALGREAAAVAFPLEELARVDAVQGRYARARTRYERALKLTEATFGKDSAHVVSILNGLAEVRQAQHRLDEALSLFTRAFALSEQRLRQESLGFSESHRLHFLQWLRTDEERLYALLRAHPGDARVRRLALGAALLRKGRSIEETASISRTVYQGLEAKDRDTFARLGALRAQLAHLSLQGPGTLSPQDYPRRLAALAEEGDVLEADLARRSAPLRALTALPSPDEVVDRVANALPRDGALVEFIAYDERHRIRVAGLVSPGVQRLRYLALVLHPDATTRAVDLGPAGPIDAAAARFRDALARRDAGIEAPAQALYQRVFQPLLPLLGEQHHLFLSPEGPLALVPFAALHDGQGFLVDAFDFTSLSSGKDLLPRPQERTAPASVVVLANPDFSPALAASQPDASAGSARSRFTDPARRAWASTPLPGTGLEAEAIRRLLPQAQLFLGPEATRERLLRLPTPGILHLATHGFFLGDVPGDAASRAVIHFGALADEPPLPPAMDPLLRSGLVFAGARSGGELVTALELAGLDLWGTQLVVLSACDTGRGDIQLGQGVYGLQRAFLVAGAETVVTSLWKVEDETTSALMKRYYHHLLAGLGRGEALREAMRALRQHRPHPYYWAPFIVVGRDAPLHGLTGALPGPRSAPVPVQPRLRNCAEVSPAGGPRPAIASASPC